MNAKKTLIFTGGHHVGALEVAKRLLKKNWSIVWFGHRHSMWGDTSDSAEYTEVTGLGIPFFDLQAGKFYNTFHPLKLLRLPWGFVQALYWVFMLKLKYLRHLTGAVSFGGYLAVPVIFSAWVFGIPSITHEQTIATGWANRFIAHFVKKIAISWPHSSSFYPPSKTVLTGLPLRPEIIDLFQKKPLSTKHLALSTIYITGGKQGSHVLNLAVFGALSRLSRKYHVIHQTGSSSLYNDHQTAASYTSANYSHFDFDSRRAISALKSADVVVSRSGAHITYELALLGKKCVLIPIPWVSHNEQHENAKTLVASHQAVLLDQSKLTPDSLISSIETSLKLSPQPIDLITDGTERLVQLIESQLS